MLLFVKSEFLKKIIDGSKTIEIRCGSRYRGISVGDRLSLNGSTIRYAKNVRRFETLTKMIAGIDVKLIGFSSKAEARRVLRTLYPKTGPQLWVAIGLTEDCPKARRERL